MEKKKNKLLLKQYFLLITDFLKTEECQYINVSLGRGLTGIVITYLQNSFKDKSNQRYELTNLMLRTIHNKLSKSELSTDIYEGTLGTILGLCYLIRKGYISSSENEFVREFDSRIYQIVTTSYNRGKKAFKCTDSKLNILLYLIIRMDKMRKTDKMIFENVIIKLINDIYNDLLSIVEDEPLIYKNLLESYSSFFLCLLAKTYSLGFYNIRILHILEEYHYKIFSRRPFLHSNRLVLLFAINEVYRYTHQKQWKEFAHQLRANISLEEIYTLEIKRNQIFFSNGIASIYLMLSHYNKYSEEKFELDKAYFYNRIAKSELWKEIDPTSPNFMYAMSLDNFGGLILLLEMITQQMKEK